MTSRSTSSTPSEGEIVETDSDKATTSLHTVKDNHVNPKSRLRVSVSRSPSPIRSPKSYRSRTRSRSPYREPRGSKRSREDDHSNDRPREDTRRFKVRYEDRPYADKRKPHGLSDLDRSRGPDPKLSYDDRYARNSDKKHRVRSRSPYSKSLRPNHARHRGTGRDFRRDGHGWQDHDRQRHDTEGRSRLSREQSVSDRGHSPVATALSKQKAETKPEQKQYSERPDSTRDRFTAKASHDGDVGPEKDQPNPARPVLDEAALIEERRKRREAIKAKHRGQATPLSVQALVLDSQSAASSPKPSADADQHQIPSQPGQDEHRASPQPNVSTNDARSAPSTPKEAAGQDSPTELVVLDDKDLANQTATSNGFDHEDEPSAADYDPTMDMQEDRFKQDNRQIEEISSGAYDETTAARPDVLLPEPSVQESVEDKVKDPDDMFADEDDMFAEAPVAPTVSDVTSKAVAVPQTKTVDMSMLDDWDDDEGYYKVIPGELLDNRYHVQSNLGRGMFSGVVRATDQKLGKLAAIKIIRNNESMKKAGLKEVDILQKLANADLEDKKHLVRLERIFEHKGHLCMVFENLSINLREVLKKFGRDVGINLKAVRAYAQQMFLGLSLLRKCNVLHADLKPDNVLVNEARNVLKICDLGSASDASENEITPYLVSRFYRAPEIILGIPYDFGIDVWSIGCTLFELYTGKILFTGRSNNQMLRAIMECRGKFSHKVLRKAEFGRQHFDDLLNFRSIEKDKLTGKDLVRILNFTKPTRDLRSRLMANAKDMDDVELKELYSFIDLLDRCLNLNPEKRCTPVEALKHPFITRVKV
ncbi:MAG: hypothetical protein L6R42_008822 [Xanthoria sp. 1 TBL-2021]|nr:MAG: hypothetical protein L6R42_008822 [Xanthoria sp. 1 TBL-2021]